MSADFAVVAELAANPEEAVVYEHGWQSWSPAGRYHAELPRSPRPARRRWQTMAFRPEIPGPDVGFHAEGLLAVQPEPDAPVQLWSAQDPTVAVPSIRLHLEGDRLVISANGPVTHTTATTDLPTALASWATDTAAAADVAAPASIPPGWCSWYCYWNEVTEDDVVAELAAMDELDLPITTAQIDDGWQAGIGDWLTTSPRFDRMDSLADRIAQTGRRAGIWTAPFLVGADSELAAQHPEWLVRGAVAAPHHWDQSIRVLDVTHPGAAEHLHHVYTTLRSWGYAYHKIDFLYAGAMVGGRHADGDTIAVYREGLRIIRDAIGDDAVLLGCGAPILPSLGLVDAMRVSPDVDPMTEPDREDISQPALRSALQIGRARTMFHDSWWVNDPDCVVVRPEVARREDWAEHCEQLGGLAVSSDPLRSLDARGLELTRRLLQPSSTRPATWDPDANRGREQGAIVAG